MKSITISLGLASMLLFQGCSLSNKETDIIPEPPPINLDNASKESQAKPIPVHETTHKAIKSTSGAVLPKSVLVNGIKMHPTQFPVVKGTRILVPQVNQYAVVTGDLVIVNQSAKLSGHIKSVYRISKIANNTFKLIPNEVNADMLERYSALQKLGTVEQVELSIFYDGIKDTRLEVK